MTYLSDEQQQQQQQQHHPHALTHTKASVMAPSTGAAGLPRSATTATTASAAAAPPLQPPPAYAESGGADSLARARASDSAAANYYYDNNNNNNNNNNGGGGGGSSSAGADGNYNSSGRLLSATKSAKLASAYAPYGAGGGGGDDVGVGSAKGRGLFSDSSPSGSPTSVRPVAPPRVVSVDTQNKQLPFQQQQFPQQAQYNQYQQQQYQQQYQHQQQPPLYPQQHHPYKKQRSPYFLPLVIGGAALAVVLVGGAIAAGVLVSNKSNSSSSSSSSSPSPSSACVSTLLDGFTRPAGSNDLALVSGGGGGIAALTWSPPTTAAATLGTVSWSAASNATSYFFENVRNVTFADPTTTPPTQAVCGPAPAIGKYLAFNLVAVAAAAAAPAAATAASGASTGTTRINFQTGCAKTPHLSASTVPVFYVGASAAAGDVVVDINAVVGSAAATPAANADLSAVVWEGFVFAPDVAAAGPAVSWVLSNVRAVNDIAACGLQRATLVSS
ncbi:hypothetical protein DFJ73DRAFT_780664 [Zopfochytrium polystomum]|nr:hypothetical protein DFJ73DRAFT_780664 [Zopfochytrium polystomum]